MSYVEVCRALAFGESRAMRAYCRAGKVLVPHGSPLLDQALVIVEDRRRLAEFSHHLLPKTAKAPVDADCVA